jgi:hypothetical protein
MFPFAVGGAEARMKGLGNSIPRNLMFSEAIEYTSQKCSLVPEISLAFLKRHKAPTFWGLPRLDGSLKNLRC